jgi:site-specific DNA-cytosine methylase
MPKKSATPKTKPRVAGQQSLDSFFVAQPKSPNRRGRSRRETPSTTIPKPRAVGVKVAKWFGGLLYPGKVVKVDEALDPADRVVKTVYKIVYNDGDGEDFTIHQLEEAKALYMAEVKEEDAATEAFSPSQKKRKAAPTKAAPKQKKPASATKAAPKQKKPARAVGTDGSDFEAEDEEEEDAVKEAFSPSQKKRKAAPTKAAPTKAAPTKAAPTKAAPTKAAPTKAAPTKAAPTKAAPKQKKPARATKAAPKQKKPARAVGTDDSDFEAEDEEDDDDLDVVMEDLSSEEEAKPKAKKISAKKVSPAETTSRSKSNKNSTSAQLQDEFKAKLDKDIASCKPQGNNPQKLPEEGGFVDPVGVDPTHGIIEDIVAAQVRKIGGLLLRATAANSQQGEAGELTFPIKLQTACSGTDAPSIALGLIKESLDRLKKDHGFAYTHEMSCEIAPFKQAYIGRNFPGVPLFPDITKLTASDKVLDVYGRPQEIPDGNLFIGGTSCKDFSMLKSSCRLDIEDKGTSGETFLAAVEFLEMKQPPVAIFENVDGAPWGKMQEYIVGRVNLAERNNAKNITSDGKKKADADNLLKFSVNEEGRYVAEEIPRQVGIRAGSVVRGFVRNGRKASDVEPLTSNKSSELVTLGQMAKQHGINLDRDMLVMEKKARYCTHLCKIDTKKYGLPQTRNRKYLFIWKSDDPEDDLGEYFEEILEHLQTPLLHSLDAFLLPETHDRLRCFREALRSGPGLLVKRDRAKELNFWDFEEARIKDVTCHMAFRKVNGIDNTARWLTGWGMRGQKLLAPGLWPELVDCWNMRRLDMVDCFGAAAGKSSLLLLHGRAIWLLFCRLTDPNFVACLHSS